MIIYKKKVKNLKLNRLINNQVIELEIGHYYLQAPNGSGKSTILKAIYQQNFADCTLISQDILLLEHLSIKDNSQLLCSNVQQVLNKFQCEYPGIQLQKVVGLLSGGQKQLLNILIAFYQPSSILLVDEPFNNLDQDKVEVVKVLLESDTRMQILVSHNIEITNYAPLSIRKQKFLCGNY